MEPATKTCFKCLCKLPLEEFYKHARMGDGRLNKCKECTKSDVKTHRQENLEKVRAYDKLRAGLPHRVAARNAYVKTESGRASQSKAGKNQRELHPAKVAARYIVSNAVRDGRLKRLPCQVCGEAKSQGHHCDYDRPLDVVWLCHSHHKQLHAQHRNYK